MKQFWKKSLILCMAAMLIVAASVVPALAVEGSAGIPAVPGTPDMSGEFVITGYTIAGNPSVITKGKEVAITLGVKHTTLKKDDVTVENIDVSRLVDSFSGGDAGAVTINTDSEALAIEVTVTGLKYKGTGQNLKLMIGANGTYSPEINVLITEAEEYVEPEYVPPQEYTPDPLPAPQALFSRNEMAEPVKADQEFEVTVIVKNTGEAVMKKPILSFSPSESLYLIGTSTALELKDISPGKTETAVIKLKAQSDIINPNQSVDLDLKFNYYNRLAYVEAGSSGKITIPAKVTGKVEKPDDGTTASPVPNVIVTNFSYGGGSVAAGSKFYLSFDFKNTSDKLDVENMVVTVDSGAGFIISGASNTFYFDGIEPKGKESISVPMKASKTVENGAQPVSVGFKYEYVDHGTRTSAASDVSLSVPVYQPDRFEISAPVVPEFIMEGEEVAVTVNYNNKSKTSISNVEASLAGNVQSMMPTQTIGNLEPGRNGTIAFAVTPFAGTNEFEIVIEYEDGNGDVKTRTIPVTMEVQAMEVFDPGMDMMPEEPIVEESGFNWIPVIAAAVVVLIIALIVLKKRKKAKAAKKEQELWANWEDELAVGGPAEATEAKPQEQKKEA